MHGADLRGADLTEAKLVGANLREADLRNVYFGEANLEGANLTDADLTSAHTFQANFNGANVRRVIGLTLEQRKHLFPNRTSVRSTPEASGSPETTDYSSASDQHP